MPPSSMFKPLLSRQELTRRLLPLITSLSLNPKDPQTLASIDSLLPRLLPLGPTSSLLALRGLSLLKKLTRAKSLISSLIHTNSLSLPFVYTLLLQCALPDAAIRDVEATWCSDLRQQPNLSNFIVHLCRHSRNETEIERIYSRISSNRWRVTDEVQAALVSAMGPSHGILVLNEMDKPDEFGFFAVFRRFCLDGNVLEAESVLRDWSNKMEVEMNVSIYGSFFYALCKSGMFGKARSLFDELTGDKNSCFEWNWSPLLEPGTWVVFQLTRPGMISKMSAFEAYFRSLCTFGPLDVAERLLKAALKKPTLPEICVYNSFIKALFRAGRVDDALKLFEFQRKKGHVPAGDIAVSVIHCLCDIGRVDDAHQLLVEMISEGFVPTARTWNQIIKSYWEVGDKEKAKELFERMRPDEETYGVMIGKFLEEGEVDRGISLVEEMVGKKLKASVDLHCGIARRLYKCGRVEESIKWLDMMIEDGILVSYERWESSYDSISNEGEGFWKEIEENYEKSRDKESNRVEGR